MLGHLDRLDDDAREAVLLEAGAGLDADGIADLLRERLPEARARLERGHKQLRAASAEPAALARTLQPYRYQATPKPRNLRPLGLAAVLVGIVVAGLLIVTHLPQTGQGWRVAWVSGAKGQDRLGEGGRVETGDEQRARLAVDDLGYVDIEPGSGVRREPSVEGGERLRLDRGALEVRIKMPEGRTFAVTTPSARVVASHPDFVIECGADGRGLVSVRDGKVAIDEPGKPGKQVVVLVKGASCRLLAEGGPGVPFFDDGPDALKDVQPDGALTAALTATTPRDALTLWYLVSRVEGDDRELVVTKIAELVPPPEGVSTAAILRLEPQALARWARVLEAHW